MTATILRSLPRLAWLAVACAAAPPALAQQQPILVQGLDCRGEEPFWNINANRTSARNSSLGPKGKREVVFSGSLQTLSVLTPPMTVWRGDSTHLPKETLVVSLREEACKSTMAEGPALTHRAILSVRSGEAVTGCCTIKAAYDAKAAPVANYAAKSFEDWAHYIPDLLAGMNLCLARDGAKAKWISKAWPMNHGNGLVRVVQADGTSVDCVADLTGRGNPQIDPVNPAAPPLPNVGNPRNVTSRYDGTALIAAAHLGHDEVVRILIKAGAPLDHVNNLHWTALIESIVLGYGGPRQVASQKALVEAGASTALTDRGGSTPLALAKGRGYGEMVAILQKAGAR